MIDIEKLKRAALKALDNMDDYARMETGIAPIGAVNHLTNFINTACTRLEAAESQLVAQELHIQQLRDALDELANLMEGVYIGAYHPDSFTNQPAKSILAIPTSTEHLEAWYQSMVGEPVAWNYELTEEAFVRLSVAGIRMDTPLHAIKPFPFKEK